MTLILIAVPTFENITPDTFKSIYDLKVPENVETRFEFVRGYDCAAARNRIAQKAIDMKADYVFMVDNDVTLPKNSIELFLEEPKDVCLGFYRHRSKNNEFSVKTCLCKLGEFNYTNMYSVDDLKNLRLTGTFKEKIHGGGMGCAFIKTSVFSRIDYPYFYWKQYQNGGTLSEDLYFCSQCNRKGIDVYADTRIGCGHLIRRIEGVL